MAEACKVSYYTRSWRRRGFLKSFFESSDIEELLLRMFEYIKTQVEKLGMSECDFTLNKIMYLHINFYKLAKPVKLAIKLDPEDIEDFWRVFWR